MTTTHETNEMTQEEIDKVLNLINKYASLTPMGLATEGMGILQEIDGWCDKHLDCKDVIKGILKDKMNWED